MMPVGSRVQAREVAIGVPAVQTPKGEQVLLVMVPLSVPVSEHVCPEGGVQVPLQLVVEPQGTPLGL